MKHYDSSGIPRINLQNVGDPLTQYLLLAGRSGTTNNPTLSTTADGTITGSSANPGKLILKGSSAALPRWNNAAYDNYVTLPNGAIAMLYQNQTFAGPVAGVICGNATLVITSDGAIEPTFEAFTSGDSLKVTYSNNRAGDTDTFWWSVVAATIGNTAGAGARSLTGIHGFGATYTVLADTNTLSVASVDGVSLNYFFKSANAGVGTLTGAVNAFTANISCDNTNWTLPIYRGLLLPSPTLTGGAAIPTVIGIDLGDLKPAGVTTAYSLRSAGLTTHLLHGGPVVIGDNVAATANTNLDFHVTAPTGAVTTNLINWASAVAFSGAATGLSMLSASPTVTHTATGTSSVNCFVFGGTTTVTATPGASSGSTGYTDQPIFSTAVGIKGVQLHNSFSAARTVQLAGTGTTTFTTPLVRGLSETITVKHAGTAGTHTVTELSGFVSNPTVSAASGATVSVTTRRGAWINDVAKAAAGGTETVVTNVGVDIDTLAAGGTTNLSIRTGTTACSFGGKFTTYNNDTTAGNGMASVVGSTNQTAQTASLGSTTILTSVAATAVYRLSAYIFCSTAGSAGTVSVTLGWTDTTSNAKSVTSSTAVLTATTSFAQTSVVVEVKTSTALTYLTTVAGATGTPKYDVYVTAERLA